MLIKILYESKYSLATVKNGENVLTGMGMITDGINKNVKEIFKKENNFLQNIKELNKYYPNYQYADITQNTILGILCRLVGEVRRLDSLNDNHPVLAIKDKIKFENKTTGFQNEVVLLHTPLKEVKNNAGGVIPEEKSHHFLLTKNSLSESLLSVFDIKNQAELIIILNGIKNNDHSLFETKYSGEVQANTFVIKHALFENIQPDIIKGLNFYEGENVIKELIGRVFYGEITKVKILEEYINSNIDKAEFKPATITDLRKKLGVNEIFNMGGFLFAKKLNFLRNNNLFEKEFENALNTGKTSIKGLAPNSGSITIKDFYTNFVTDKKMSWSMPYSVEVKKDLFVQADLKEFNTGVKLGVTKECGELIIYLDLSSEAAADFYKKIEAAGVNTFHMGKKGLAYVSDIILEAS